MKPIILRSRYAIGVWLLAMLCASALAGEESTGALPPSLVSVEVLEAKIAEVEAAADTQAETKSALIADARRERHPPKLKLFDDYFLLLMNGLDASNTTGM